MKTRFSPRDYVFFWELEESFLRATKLVRSSSCIIALFRLADVYAFNSTVSSQLTASSKQFVRPNSQSGRFYYDTIQVTVPTTGPYIFRSTSPNNYNSYGFLYSSPFYPALPLLNLLTLDDNSGGGNQFRFTAVLEAGSTYILVVSSSNHLVTGSYSVIVSGAGRANLVLDTTAALTSKSHIGSRYVRENLCLF